MLEQYIRDRLRNRSTLLMTHAVAGYPSLEDNWEMLACMRDAGVDLVELQMPFSEPIADGPAFIRANQIALDNGLHWRDYLDFLERAAGEFDFPMLFMGYYNSILSMGHDQFCDSLKAAGGSGFIVADLPLEMSSELDVAAARHRLDHIEIMTPLNSPDRLARIAEASSGFLYCVARKGVTGRETDFTRDIGEYMHRCRSATGLPLALGFGIRTADQIRDMKGLADIAIVGTACLEAWEQRGLAGYRSLLSELIEAGA